VTARSGDFRRILLIRCRALGDALVSLPAVTAVADAWPGAHIDLVVDRSMAALFSGLATNVNVLAYPHADGQPWVRWLRCQHYDLVIDWLGSPRTAVWTALSGARMRVGYDLPRRRWAYNLRVPRNRAGSHPLRGFAGEAFLDPLRALGLAPEPWQPAVDRHSADAAAAAAETPFGRWLSHWRAAHDVPRAVLVMSATWSAKAWSARHVAGLWRRLEEEGVRAVLAPGPGDEALVDALRAELPPTAFVPPTSLAEMAVLLRCSDVFIGTDNGLRHLAALLGLPTVTLFGPTDPAGWNPPGPRHVGVQRGEACSPCDLKECPVPGRPCLENLGFEPVAAAAMDLLRAYGPARTAADRSAGPDRKATTC
jgi:ADP-heptose:LPS heptosyltransferase